MPLIWVRKCVDATPLLLPIKIQLNHVSCPLHTAHMQLRRTGKHCSSSLSLLYRDETTTSRMKQRVRPKQRSETCLSGIQWNGIVKQHRVTYGSLTKVSLWSDNRTAVRSERERWTPPHAHVHYYNNCFFSLLLLSIIYLFNKLMGWKYG